MTFNHSIHKLIPRLLLNESYDQGRYGKANEQGDWNQQMRGRDDKNRWDAVTQNSNEKKNPGAGTGGGGGTGGSGTAASLLILAIFVIPLVVISALSSLLLAFVLLKYIKQIEPENYPPSFKQSYRITFALTFLYQIISSASSLLLSWLAYKNLQAPFLTTENIPATQNNFLVIIIYQLPAVLITAILLHRKLKNYDKFYGRKGYFRSFMIVLVGYLPLISFVSYVIWKGSHALVQYFF